MSSLRPERDTPGFEVNHTDQCAAHGVARVLGCAECVAFKRAAVDAAVTAAFWLAGGAAPAEGQRSWLRAVEAHPDAAVLRGDGWRNLHAVARVVMWRASRCEITRAWTSIPTRTLIMRRTGLRETAAKGWVRWLRERGFLGTVTAGSTPQYRPGIHDDGAGNLGAEYILMIPGTLRRSARRSGPQNPAPAITTGPAAPAATAAPPAPAAPSDDHPVSPVSPASIPGPAPALHAVPGPVSGDEKRPPSVVLQERTTEDLDPRNTSARRAREEADKANDSKINMAGSDTVWTWSLSVTPGTRVEMLKAAQALRSRSATLRRISARHLRSVLREWWVAGWTPDDVLHGLDHRPDGQPWTLTSDPAYVPGWIRHRLTCWRTPDGTPATSYSQGRAQRRAAAAAALTETRERRAAALTQRADATTAAAAARAQLTAASPKADEAMRRQRAQQADQARRAAKTATTTTAPVEEAPLTPMTEPEEAFAREVLARHDLPATTWATEPEPELNQGSDDTATLAAERAWLVQMMAGRTQENRR
ncbi:hypothetical protein [Streptosporangium sp. NPDC051022]|uniref:hypothetical protein n=1 Tax=Streptosporangium sp. NPDC051022 TaxID=3155752 RepID=UPI0034277A47